MMTNHLFVMFNASHAYRHSTSVIIQALDAVQTLEAKCNDWQHGVLLWDETCALFLS